MRRDVRLTEPAITATRNEDGRSLPMLAWRFAKPVRAVASGPLGGGIGIRHWVLNATVVKDYGRLDPDVHLRELAASLGLAGEGTGMLTAVDVGNATSASDGGVAVVATVGLGYPTWAAAENDAPAPVAGPGTINILAYIPAPLTDAALVNTVATATEAKVQALLSNGANCTGTATDALFIATPIAAAGEELESFGGPRSRWGACLARAVFEAVGTGTQEWRRRGTS